MNQLMQEVDLNPLAEEDSMAEDDFCSQRNLMPTKLFKTKDE